MLKLRHHCNWNWSDVSMITIIYAISSGLTIVLSRSINGYLSKKTNPYQSTFFNYLTGLLTSMLILSFTDLPSLQITWSFQEPTMLLGGIIGIFNILILNFITTKITPIKLTLITFISQLVSGVILDYCFYNILTINKLIGCLIVIIGLLIYHHLDNKPL